LRILIFDDDIARSPERLIIPPSLEVRIVDRADECLELVASFRAASVFMDFHMNSSLKGDEAIRRLRAYYDKDALTIIGISSAPSLNQRMIEAGANRAIPKKDLPDALFELGLEAEEGPPIP